MKAKILTLALALTSLGVYAQTDSIATASDSVAKPEKKVVKMAFRSKPKPTAAQLMVDSLNKIKDAAVAGDATSQNIIGEWYYNGNHYTQDYKKALEWWSRAAKQNFAPAIGNMAICYQTGHGVEADSVRATKLYIESITKGNTELLNRQLELADKGNVFSNALLAECYLEGAGNMVKKNPEEAVPYMDVLIKAGHIDLARQAGLILTKCKRFADAYNYFQKGIPANDSICYYYVGAALLEGRGVAKNEKRGVDHIIIAAEKEVPGAMYLLANCYAKGRGVSVQDDKADLWYTLASGAGIGNAQFALAERLRKNGDFNAALYRYAQAAANGRIAAVKAVIKDSIGSTPFMSFIRGMKAYDNHDYEEALRIFNGISKAKNPDVQAMIATIYSTPDYNKYNVKKAVKMLLDLTSKQQNALALYQIGLLYAEGRGVAKNIPMAENYFSQAAMLGYGPAICALGDISYEGRNINIDLESAKKSYMDAVYTGWADESTLSRLKLMGADTSYGARLKPASYDEVYKLI